MALGLLFTITRTNIFHFRRSPVPMDVNRSLGTGRAALAGDGGEAHERIRLATDLARGP